MIFELKRAIDELRKMPTDRIWLIPLLIDNCPIPDRSIGAGETLRSLQWVKMFENWEDGLSRLVNSILPRDEVEEALTYVSTHLFEAHRGAILWDSETSLIFDNRIGSEYIEEVRSVIRRFLKANAIKELAESHGGSSWVMLVKSDKARILHEQIWGTYPEDEAKDLQMEIAFRRVVTYWNSPHKS